MESKLSKVQDWPALAKWHSYRVRQVAQELGITPRALENYVQRKFGNTPRKLFVEWRAQEIAKLARAGVPGEQIAQQAGFANCANLCRSIKMYSGFKLKDIRC